LCPIDGVVNLINSIAAIFYASNTPLAPAIYIEMISYYD